MITGGLNKGVDQLIGDEVKKRLANKEKIPLAVLGIGSWGCLKEKKNLLSVKYTVSLAALLAYEMENYQVINSTAGYPFS